ncbi:site-specific DNA-methyltransferase [Streptomyces phaeochromogenes]|uniref:Methyltransferase n=1 Tax=Streptomyces phaeochromogenes TaxID=1923 RepID=A0ABZ1HDZ6_STRPH|nr:site-specific DNA-methyltransferase [Streptomyces phaeochromogenes]WSD16314.1 site-specific DNA-methyltransferase [Streptomyces phaeochromogenes]
MVAQVEMEQNETSEPEATASDDAPIQVRQGDAYDLMADLPAESIDLLITSPPYWGLRAYGQEHNEEILKEWLAEDSERVQTDVPPYEWYRKHGGVLGLEPLPEWFIGHLVEILQRGAAALKPEGSMWINIGDTYFARWSSIRHDGRQGLGDNPRSRRRTPMGGFRQEKQLLLIPARFAIAMQDLRWILRNDLIWHKPNVPPRPEKDRLRLAHEHFFHFVKRPKEGRAKYHYDMDEVEHGARDVVFYDFDEAGYDEADPSYYDFQEVEEGEHDVVTTHVRSGSDGHSATFPIGLIKPRILSSCPPGGTVLDPFCGTGRSLTVAAESGRRAIGFELSAEFHEAAQKNSDQSLGQLTLELPDVE